MDYVVAVMTPKAKLVARPPAAESQPVQFYRAQKFVVLMDVNRFSERWAMDRTNLLK